MPTTLSIGMTDAVGKRIPVNFYIDDSINTLAGIITEGTALATALDTFSGCIVTDMSFRQYVDISGFGLGTTPAANARAGGGATMSFPLVTLPNRSWSHYVPAVPDTALSGEALNMADAAVAQYANTIANGGNRVNEYNLAFTDANATGIEASRKL